MRTAQPQLLLTEEGACQQTNDRQLLDLPLEPANHADACCYAHTIPTLWFAKDSPAAAQQQAGINRYTHIRMHIQVPC